ncbi:SDR family oxidoreductase [Devriesea agamarum]|uniref:SDR family oxidoreductase n=1 Tax=Devriesea agamarum TaxID=472569 RepID=UPI00071E5622|nr:SDR family oxidoreductase [Devriesea agamarum]
MTNIAVVTGAARGIGRAVAERLLADYPDLIVVAADILPIDWATHHPQKTPSNHTASPLTPCSRVRARHVDVTDERAVAELFTEAAELGHIQAVAHVAGIFTLRPIVDTPLKEYERIQRVNSTGTFLVLREAARAMSAQSIPQPVSDTPHTVSNSDTVPNPDTAPLSIDRSALPAGHNQPSTERNAAPPAAHNDRAIVAVTSNAARVPRIGMGAYGAAKASASSLATTLALELADQQIRCNVVCPGSTDTAMQREFWGENPDAGHKAAVHGDAAQYRLGIPLGRLASPEDVADAVAYLLSPGARHLTMQELYVDGGASLRA